MTGAGEIEKRFKNNPIYIKETRSCEIMCDYAWKYLSMFFEKPCADSGSLTEFKYLRVCNACKRVYICVQGV